MDLPNVVKGSGLYARLQEDNELLTAIVGLRTIAERLAETVARSVPDFTDHTVRHMDALWGVSDQVLTSTEIGTLSTAEAFLLATGFYLHDIGMAYAANEEGLRRVRSSAAYLTVMATVPDSERSLPGVEARAIALAVRSLHANAALELATRPVLGTEYFLFESTTFREAWAETCGRISASHHWSLETIERELGSAGIVPLPGARSGDLGFVAAVLRLIDYAHISRDRAPSIDRAFRQPIDNGSVVHWLAQEQIDGPSRDGDDLVYRGSGAITNVDAWWLFYEMLSGPETCIDELALVLDDVDEVHYASGDEEKIGTLNFLWPDVKDAPLFSTIIGIIAEAWQANLAALIEQDGWRHKGSVLTGRLTRP